MTNTRIILFSIVMAILLAILVLWCAEVLAGVSHRHGCGDEWKWHNHENTGDDYDKMHHSCDNPVEFMEWLEARDKDGEPSACLRLARRLGISSGKIPKLDHTARLLGGGFVNTPDRCGGDDDEKPPPPNPLILFIDDDNSGLADESTGDSFVIDGYLLGQHLDVVLESESVIPTEIEQEVEEIEPPEPVEPVVLDSHEYSFHQGWNFVVFVVLPEDVETLGGIYDTLLGEERDLTLVVLVGNRWLIYRGEGETGDVRINGNMGVAVHAPHWFIHTLFGNKLETSEQIDLVPGLNFIGFPELPDRYERPSDLLGVSELVFREVSGEFFTVGRAGDPGDAPIEDAEALLVFTLKAAQAAPMAQKQGTLAMTWGAIKQNGN